MFLITPIKKISSLLFVLSWDLLLIVINFITPRRKIGHVIPEGHPGFGGKWPEFIPPKPTDSRCACPALNAMANHGILPRDGRNISFREMNHKIRATYNFSPTFCYFVPHFAAEMLNKSYWTGKFDLEEISLHNGIEHDASLTRDDLYHQPDQGVPHAGLIKELLASATGIDQDGNKVLTIQDMAKISGKRRSEARASNPDFSLAKQHKMFGASNSSTLLTIYGGKVKDLETILLEERIPDGWEPSIRERMGLTMLTFNLRTVLPMEFSTKETELPKSYGTFQTTSGAGGSAGPSRK
ncbi:hypothetical protein AX16_003376 [Volvariella volvacea WC 439]|nr:hypothetical protein AX16_003376 [Volvariella volvacea WC 439]